MIETRPSLPRGGALDVGKAAITISYVPKSKRSLSQQQLEQAIAFLAQPAVDHLQPAYQPVFGFGFVAEMIAVSREEMRELHGHLARLERKTDD